MREIMSDIVSDYFDHLSRRRNDPLSEIGIIAHIHCLPSMTSTLLAWFLASGFRRELIVVIPKPYSTIPSAIEEIRGLGILVGSKPDEATFQSYDPLSNAILRQGFQLAEERMRGVRRLLLLDDGGLLTDVWSRHFRESFPQTISVQQTTSGTMRRGLPGWGIYYVDAARSVAKTVFESPIIARGIWRKMQQLSEYTDKSSIGVVGFGAIGSQVARAFARDGRRVFAFDKRNPPARLSGVRNCSSLSELLNRSRVIAGCTGRNWLSLARVDVLASQEHVLISCSSRAVEFQTLMAQPYVASTAGLFSNHYADPPARRRQLILNGGFPINFDRVREWENEEEIILTRALIFAAVLQALTLPTQAVGTTRVRLDPQCQKLLVEAWLKSLGLRADAFGVDDIDFGDITWWEENSAGTSFDAEDSAGASIDESLCCG